MDKKPCECQLSSLINLYQPFSTFSDSRSSLTFFPKPGDDIVAGRSSGSFLRRAPSHAEEQHSGVMHFACPTKPDLKLTAAGTAPVLHRSSLFIPIQRIGNQLLAAKVAELWIGKPYQTKASLLQGHYFILRSLPPRQQI